MYVHCRDSSGPWISCFCVLSSQAVHWSDRSTRFNQSTSNLALYSATHFVSFNLSCGCI